MKVAAHEPQTWYLLSEGDQFYLDVRCEANASEYSILLQLSDQERTEYRRVGRTAVERLADAVRNSPTLYWDRNVSKLHDSRVLEAIRLWQSAGGGARV